jgi:hypothetical protein
MTKRKYETAFARGYKDYKRINAADDAFVETLGKYVTAYFAGYEKAKADIRRHNDALRRIREALAEADQTINSQKGE